MIHQLTEGLSFGQWAHAPTEALPRLQHHRDKIVVVKYDDNAMTGLKLKGAFAQDMIFLRIVGVEPVVVHDGGSQISSILERLGLEGEFRDGFRVTTSEVMEIIRMVLLGQVGHEPMSLINAYGPYTVGTSGEGGSLFIGARHTVNIGGKETDIGLVGNITEVHSETLLDLIDVGCIPVVSTITPSIDSEEVYNINADTAASALALVTNANYLVILANVKGPYTGWPNRDSLVPRISTLHLREILLMLDSGMIPKMEPCLSAVDQGVSVAHTTDDRQSHSVLLELMTSGGTGTMVKPG